MSFSFFLNNLIPNVAEKYSDFGGGKKKCWASRQKKNLLTHVARKKNIAPPLEVDALIHVPFISLAHIVLYTRVNK